jgi:hypothetical protein
MTKKTIIYKKCYIKVQEIFSQLGGFISLTFSILDIFYWPFLIKKKNFKIINEFYEFDEDDEKLNKKVNKNIINIKLEEIYNQRVDDSRRKINQKKDNINNLNKEENNIIKENVNNQENKNYKDSELIKILKDKKKKFSNLEILRASYYLICCNQNLKKKNSKYNLAVKNINIGTDYLEHIKLNRDFKILKYLLFNNVQQRAFDFLISLKLGADRYYDINEYPEIINANDIFESLKIIKKYYQTKSSESGISRTDDKLLSIFHPKIMKIMNAIDIEN